jgi:hypothetical protein
VALDFVGLVGHRARARARDAAPTPLCPINNQQTIPRPLDHAHESAKTEAAKVSWTIDQTLRYLLQTALHKEKGQRLL